jgi:hypothetical protein
VYKLQKEYKAAEKSDWDDEDEDDTQTSNLAVDTEKPTVSSAEVKTLGAKECGVQEYKTLSETNTKSTLSSLPPPSFLKPAGLTSLSALPSLQPLKHIQNPLPTPLSKKEEPALINASTNVVKKKEDEFEQLEEEDFGDKDLDDLLSLSDDGISSKPSTKTNSIPTVPAHSPSLLHGTSSTPSPLPTRSELAKKSTSNPNLLAGKRSEESLTTVSKNVVSELSDDDFFKPVTPVTTPSLSLPAAPQKTTLTKDVIKKNTSDEEISDFDDADIDYGEDEDEDFKKLIAKASASKEEPKKQTSTGPQGITIPKEVTSTPAPSPAVAPSSDSKTPAPSPAVSTFAERGIALAPASVISTLVEQDPKTPAPSPVVATFAEKKPSDSQPDVAQKPTPSFLNPLQPTSKPASSLLGSLPPLKSLPKLDAAKPVNTLPPASTPSAVTNTPKPVATQATIIPFTSSSEMQASLETEKKEVKPITMYKGNTANNNNDNDLTEEEIEEDIEYQFDDDAISAPGDDDSDDSGF